MCSIKTSALRNHNIITTLKHVKITIKNAWYGWSIILLVIVWLYLESLKWGI